MAVANIANVPVANDPASLLNFSFANQAHHRDVIAALATITGTQLPIYDMDPISSESLGTFLAVHQQSHNDINGALGTEGVDLTAVDFADPQQLEAWIRLHFLEHLQWATVLGVS